MVEQQGQEGAAEKRQFLVHIDVDLIRRIKILAIERDVSASSLVQQALTAFLNQEANPAPHARAPESN